MSITHLVIDEHGELAAIFTLTHKALEISNDKLSDTTRRRLCRYARLNKDNNCYTMSAFLIAQFGTNYKKSTIESVNGNSLMESAMKILYSVQKDFGGGVVYLECEDKPQLLSFL